ncbi:hypothetical protein [Spirochaeta cellobiosiphila]|uniref:hypothetical protein n=1 Tax=Spirochaeta cellobiosiphila TaxID=504483 RepID=UPI000425B75F|nr:hypothetical protein [Spirochaeta cellobiosiphila]
MITKEFTNFIDTLKEGKPDNIFLLLDSAFSRLSISKSYTGDIPLRTGELKMAYGDVRAFLDHLPLEFRGEDFFFFYPKPVFITGMGLYGEEFINELRQYEAKEGREPSTIILFGSPRIEKTERLSAHIDWHIDIRKTTAIHQLIYLLNHLDA